MVLSMDNRCSLDLDDIIAKIKAQYEDIVNLSQAKAWYQTKFQTLQAQAGKHGDDLPNTWNETAEMNQIIQRKEAKIYKLKNQPACQIGGCHC